MILDYRQEDVMETAALAEKMLPEIQDLPNIPGLKARRLPGRIR